MLLSTIPVRIFLPVQIICCLLNIRLSGLQHLEAFLPSKSEEEYNTSFLSQCPDVYLYSNFSRTNGTAIVQKQSTEIVQKQSTEIVQKQSTEI